MPHRLNKHKLLLDEGLYPKNILPRTNNRHNLRHIKLDLNKGGISDKEVYEIARRQRRIIITYNINHFKRLAEKSKESGVVGIAQGLIPEELDKKLNALLSRNSRKVFYGKYTPLNKGEK